MLVLAVLAVLVVLAVAGDLAHDVAVLEADSAGAMHLNSSDPATQPVLFNGVDVLGVIREQQRMLSTQQELIANQSRYISSLQEDMCKLHPPHLQLEPPPLQLPLLRPPLQHLPRLVQPPPPLLVLSVFLSHQNLGDGCDDRPGLCLR